VNNIGTFVSLAGGLSYQGVVSRRLWINIQGLPLTICNLNVQVS